MCHVCGFTCYLCVELKLMINTRSLSNQALKSAHTSRLSSRCWPWGVFIGAGQPLQHGEVSDTNLAWVRPVGCMGLLPDSNFNYCPLVWFFTSRESINKIDKIQERALRFVLKDHTSSYNDLLLKSGFHSFRIHAVKSLMTELLKILEGMAPDYLSELFVEADNPYDTRDKWKLIQPLKRTTTYIYIYIYIQYLFAHKVQSSKRCI